MKRSFKEENEMRRNISATVLRSKSDQYEMLCGIFMEN